LLPIQAICPDAAPATPDDNSSRCYEEILILSTESYDLTVAPGGTYASAAGRNQMVKVVIARREPPPADRSNAKAVLGPKLRSNPRDATGFPGARHIPQSRHRSSSRDASVRLPAQAQITPQAQPFRLR
jgi:hypothetical protein